MLSVTTLLPVLKHGRYSTTAVKKNPSAQRSPVMRQRPGRSGTASGQAMQQASYYLDASWQTRKAFRALSRAATTPGETLSPKPANALLTGHVDTLLWSIRPGLPDDGASKALFLASLDRQLQAMGADTLGWLSTTLNTAKYDCFVMEDVIDDEVFIDHGFANGPPHTRQRTLLTTPEFREKLEQAQDLAQKAASAPPVLLPPAQAQTTRDQLSLNAARWKTSDRSLASLQGLVQALAGVLDTEIAVPLAAHTTPLPPDSTVAWHEGGLVIDREVATALSHPAADELFARVQRDLLECLLMRRHAVLRTDCRDTSAGHRQSVWQVIEQVECLPPSIVMTEALRQQLRQSMYACQQRCSIQIMPALGAALGHAWITPQLSVVPDKKFTGQIIGTRYMHGGAQPQARHSTINEWPIRWLTGPEIDEWHPAQEAWHLDVPVEAQQLDTAARELVREWKASDQRYRFAEVTPDKPASGCRISVWSAVRRGMTPAIRECFDAFNTGLPLPDTPTEVWERLRGFRQWLEAVTQQ